MEAEILAALSAHVAQKKAEGYSWKGSFPSYLDLKGTAELLKPFLERKAQDFVLNSIKTIPESIRNNYLAPAVGRVVTNTIPPNFYGNKLLDLQERFRPRNIGNTLKSIYLDQSAFGKDNINPVDFEGSKASQPLYREYFNMPPKDINQYFLHEGKNYSFNPQNEFSANEIYNIQHHSQNELGNNFVQGGYIRGIPDKWNFDLHSDDIPIQNQPYDITSYLRQLVENLTGQNAPSLSTDYSNLSVNDLAGFLKTEESAEINPL